MNRDESQDSQEICLLSNPTLLNITTTTCCATFNYRRRDPFASYFTRIHVQVVSFVLFRTRFVSRRYAGRLEIRETFAPPDFHISSIAFAETLWSRDRLRVAFNTRSIKWFRATNVNTNFYVFSDTNKTHALLELYILHAFNNIRDRLDEIRRFRNIDHKNTLPVETRRRWPFRWNRWNARSIEFLLNSKNKLSNASDSLSLESKNNIRRFLIAHRIEPRPIVFPRSKKGDRWNRNTFYEAPHLACYVNSLFSFFVLLQYVFFFFGSTV